MIHLTSEPCVLITDFHSRRPLFTGDGSSVSRSRPHMATASPDHDTCLSRGLYFDLFHGFRVWKAMTSWGEWLPGIRVPIGTETELDVICALADALDAADPLPPSASTGATRPVLTLVRDERPQPLQESAARSPRSALPFPTPTRASRGPA